MAGPTETRRFFPAAYYVKEKDLGSRRFESQIHKTRDGVAITELSPLLYEAGYTYGGTILNVPEDVRKTLNKKGRVKATQVNIGCSDVILLATRPALDDVDDEDERPLRRSGSDLEHEMFRALRLFFQTIDRSEAILSEHVDLTEADSRLRAVNFRIRQGGRILSYDTAEGEIEPDDPQLTVGYVAAMPQIFPDGPRLLAAFGMGGTETLWLCHLLRTGLADEWRQAIRATEARIRIIRFRVPCHAPFPMLHGDLGELQPEVFAGSIVR